MSTVVGQGEPCAFGLLALFSFLPLPPDGMLRPGAAARPRGHVNACEKTVELISLLCFDEREMLQWAHNRMRMMDEAIRLLIHRQSAIVDTFQQRISTAALERKLGPSSIETYAGSCAGLGM